MNSRTTVGQPEAKPKTTGGRQGSEGLDALWAEYHASHSVEARNALVEAYAHLVRREAYRIAGALSHVISPQELESAGTIGLIDSIDHFDPDQGYKFVTFCMPRVRGAMLDELRSWDWTPRATRAKLNRLDRAVRKLARGLGRDPEDAEIASELGVSEEEVRRLYCSKNRTLISLDHCWNGHDGDAVPNAILADPRGTDPLRHLQRKELIETVRGMLTKTERLVVTLYYYERLTLREIGQVLRVTESRISQIHTEIVRRLKKRLAS